MGKLRTGQSASKCPQAQPRSVQTTRKWAKYIKKHRKEWETLPEFEVWLRADRDDEMLSFCNVCKTTIRPHKSDLAKHAQTTKHRANYNRFNYSGEYIVPDKKERDPLAIEIIKPENPQSVKAEKPRPVKAEKPRPVKADNPRPIKPEESIIIEDIEVEEEYLDENTMAKLDEKIGFIGGGNMAYAIGSGLINRGIVKAGQVTASGPNVENLERWRLIGAGATDDNTETIEKSDIIFICVKPHILEPCSQQIKSLYVPTSKDKDKLFVSVLAGVNLNVLENSFSFIKGLKMIRTMPNTSMQVGEGCTVYTPGSYVTQQDLEKVHLMLNTLGIAQQVPENMIDAITGIAGCGPAYVYTIIEALADGGVKQGIPRQMALQFAAQTLLGAAKTVLLTGKHPAVLRDEVCSPGGSTICGVHELEKGGLRSTLMNAVEKASQRSAELGKK